MGFPVGFKKFFYELSKNRKSVKIIMSKSFKDIIVSAASNKHYKNNNIIRLFNESINSNGYIKRSFLQEKHYNFFNIIIDDEGSVFSSAILLRRLISFFNFKLSGNIVEDYFNYHWCMKRRLVRNGIIQNERRRFLQSEDLELRLVRQLEIFEDKKGGENGIFSGRTRLGSVIRATFKGVCDSEIENFLCYVKYIIDKNKSKNLSSIKEITGDEILYYYNACRYNKKENGSLGSSCMRYLERNSFMELYAKNKNCSMIIYEDSKTKELCGRAILWTDSTGKKLVDRLYYSADKYGRVIYNYCVKNNYSFIHDSVIRFSTNQKILRKDICIQLEQSEFENYPYVDTMCYLDVENNRLHSEQLNNSFIQLRSQYGRLEYDGLIDKFRLNSINLNNKNILYCNNSNLDIDKFILKDNTLIELDAYKIIDKDEFLKAGDSMINSNGEYIGLDQSLDGFNIIKINSNLSVYNKRFDDDLLFYEFLVDDKSLFINKKDSEDKDVLNCLDIISKKDSVKFTIFNDNYFSVNFNNQSLLFNFNYKNLFKDNAKE